MGIAKRIQAEEEDKRGVALMIAVEAGVVTECEYHPGTFTDGDEEIEKAYRLASKRYSAGEFQEMFKSQIELTDTIKDVVADNAGGECYSCNKYQSE